MSDQTQQGGTPLDALIPHLRNLRGLASLQYGLPTYGKERLKPITTVEQLAAMSDLELREYKNVGATTVYYLREATGVVLRAERAERKATAVLAAIQAWVDTYPAVAPEEAADVETRMVARLRQMLVGVPVPAAPHDILLDDYRDHADTGTPLSEYPSDITPMGSV